jgi:hypothetical protein
MKKGSPGFDIVTINMAIMDIPTIEPLVRALPKLLAKDGMYVTLTWYRNHLRH